MQPSPRNFRNDNSGVAAIEFALILPVLLLILLGVVEFGVYFMKEQIVQRTVSTTVAAIEQDPSDASILTDAGGSGAGLVNYAATGNYICAKAYLTVAEARSGLCQAGDWDVDAPSGHTAGAPYYVGLVAYVQQSSFTAMFSSFIPAIKVTSTFKVGAGSSGSSGNLPTCPAGQTLTSNGSGWVCQSSVAAGCFIDDSAHGGWGGATVSSLTCHCPAGMSVVNYQVVQDYDNSGGNALRMAMCQGTASR